MNNPSPQALFATLQRGVLAYACRAISAVHCHPRRQDTPKRDYFNRGTKEFCFVLIFISESLFLLF